MAEQATIPHDSDTKKLGARLADLERKVMSIQKQVDGGGPCPPKGGWSPTAPDMLTGEIELLRYATDRLTQILKLTNPGGEYDYGPILAGLAKIDEAVFLPVAAAHKGDDPEGASGAAAEAKAYLQNIAHQGLLLEGTMVKAGYGAGPHALMMSTAIMGGMMPVLAAAAVPNVATKVPAPWYVKVLFWILTTVGGYLVGKIGDKIMAKDIDGAENLFVESVWTEVISQPSFNTPEARAAAMEILIKKIEDQGFGEADKKLFYESVIAKLNKRKTDEADAGKKAAAQEIVDHVTKKWTP